LPAEAASRRQVDIASAKAQNSVCVGAMPPVGTSKLGCGSAFKSAWYDPEAAATA
jgi:hypothetical protein